jgi:hypothetical protein
VGRVGAMCAGSTPTALSETMSGTKTVRRQSRCAIAALLETVRDAPFGNDSDRAEVMRRRCRVVQVSTRHLRPWVPQPPAVRAHVALR